MRSVLKTHGHLPLLKPQAIRAPAELWGSCSLPFVPCSTISCGLMEMMCICSAHGSFPTQPLSKQAARSPLNQRWSKPALLQPRLSRQEGKLVFLVYAHGGAGNPAIHFPMHWMGTLELFPLIQSAFTRQQGSQAKLRAVLPPSCDFHMFSQLTMPTDPNLFPCCFEEAPSYTVPQEIEHIQLFPAQHRC